MKNCWFDPSNEAQKVWFKKWSHEDSVCEKCSKHKACTALDRQNLQICQNLRERLCSSK